MAHSLPAVVLGLSTLLAVGCVGETTTDTTDAPTTTDAKTTADTGTPPPQEYSVSGTLDGLVSGEVDIQLNGTEDLTLTKDGGFAFATPIVDGGSYAVTVSTQPAGHTCEVSAGAGSIDGADVDDVVVSCSLQAFTISGTATGVVGDGAVLQNNASDDLAVVKDGAFTFATPVPYGASYDVTVSEHPACPTRACSITAGAGVMGTADVTDVVLTCDEPAIRLITGNWIDGTMYLTDDLWSHADGDTVKARVVSDGIGRIGSDAIAVDRERGLAYVANSSHVQVWDDLDTIDGKKATAVRRIEVKGYSGLRSIALDGPRDRLYVRDGLNLHILDAASTLDGQVLARATVALTLPTGAGAMVLDRTRDVLYLAGHYAESVQSFDAASKLTGASKADREVRWTDATGFNGPGANGLAIDACNDRLYITSNWSSPAGNTVVAFDDASLLDGDVDLDKDTDLRLSAGDSLAALLDEQDRLYLMSDSVSTGTTVWIHENASTLVGEPTVTPLELHGVRNRGYAFDWMAH